MARPGSRLPTVAAWSETFAAWLDEGDLAEVRHGLLRLSDDLRSVDGVAAQLLCAQPPVATGSAGVDAALASLVEYTLVRAGVDPPAWTASVPPAGEPFYVVINDAIRDLVRSGTPEAFSKRSVWVPAVFWESV